MKNLDRFFNKLACAFIIVIAVIGCLEPLDNNILTSVPNQVVYAKKSKVRNKKVTAYSKNFNDSPVYKWSSPTASVYLNLTNKKLISASKEAISAWNNTNAFTFTETNNKKDANIVIDEVYDQDCNYAGYTTSHYYVKSGELVLAETKLNTYYLENHSPYDYSHDRIVNTVEHELGHAIGLKHDSGESVMYPTGSIYSIQKDDIQALKDLYNN